MLGAPDDRAGTSDDELERVTRNVTKDIVQTLANRSCRQRELDAGGPHASAERQRALDRETVAGYRDSVASGLRAIRREYVANVAWTRDLECLAADPQRSADLRELVIHLQALDADR